MFDLQTYLLDRVEKTNGCWLWTLACDGGGYGIATWQGRTRRPHRLAYEAFIGPIPEDRHVLQDK